MTGLAGKIGLDIGTKVLAIAGGVTSVGLAIALAWVTVAKNAEIHTLEKSINDPVTGYAARLKQAETDYAQCKSNRITLEEATRRQNEAVAAAKAEGQKRLDALGRQLETAKAATRSAEKRAAAILAAKPGEDICASADALILENLP